MSCVSLSCRSLHPGLGGASAPDVAMETAGLGVRLGDFPRGERGRRFPVPSPRAEGVVPVSSDLSSLTTASPGLGLRRLEMGLKALFVFGERTTLWSPSSLVAVMVGVAEGEEERGGVGVLVGKGFPCLARLISVPRGLGGMWGCDGCSSITGGPSFLACPATPTLPLARETWLCRGLGGVSEERSGLGLRSGFLARGVATGRRVGLETLSSESLLSRLSHCRMRLFTSRDLPDDVPTPDDPPNTGFPVHELLDSLSTSESDVVGLGLFLFCISLSFCSLLSLRKACVSLMLKYSGSSVSESAVVELLMLEVMTVALFSWWMSAPSGVIIGAPESAASSDIFLCPGRLGLTSTFSCVGIGISESFLLTAVCLADGGEPLNTLVGSAASRESFRGCSEGMGEGDSSRMVGGALRPLVGRGKEFSISFDFLIVTLFLTDCLQ